MRYWLNVYWAGSVYLSLRFYTAWTKSGHSPARWSLSRRDQKASRVQQRACWTEI